MRPGDIAVRGVRQKTPSKVIVGRVSSGDGPVEFITLADLAYHLVATGVVGGPSGPSGADVLQQENGDIIQAEDGSILTI